jgi:hypothetical protein
MVKIEEIGSCPICKNKEWVEREDYLLCSVCYASIKHKDI